MSVDGKLLCAVALGIFRASFHEDEPAHVITEKWNEWEDDRAMAFRRAHHAIRAYEQHKAQFRERQP